MCLRSSTENKVKSSCLAKIVDKNKQKNNVCTLPHIWSNKIIFNSQSYTLNTMQKLYTFEETRYGRSNLNDLWFLILPSWNSSQNASYWKSNTEIFLNKTWKSSQNVMTCYGVLRSGFKTNYFNKSSSSFYILLPFQPFQICHTL